MKIFCYNTGSFHQSSSEKKMTLSLRLVSEVLGNHQTINTSIHDANAKPAKSGLQDIGPVWWGIHQTLMRCLQSLRQGKVFASCTKGDIIGPQSIGQHLPSGLLCEK